MQNPRLAGRYAKSLFDLALERNETETAKQDMETLLQTYATSKDFAVFMKSPIITADKKENAVNQIFQDKLSPLTFQFLKLSISKGREKNMNEIAQSFLELYKQHNNITTVTITSAHAIAEDMQNQIVAKIKENSQLNKIEIVNLINEKLIGGFTLQIGDKFIDASIQRDLQDIKKQFLQNLYIKNIR
jgi:F-type H+-transporting ATPase subunit delta